MSNSMLQPLLLTMLGAAGTGLGGLLVVLQPQTSFKRLGALQGLAAGLMLSISLIDLLPEAAEEIGFIPANLCFYAGVLFFAAIVALIPEPEAAMSAQPHPSPQPLQAAAGAAGSSRHKPEDRELQQALLDTPPAPTTPASSMPLQQPVLDEPPVVLTPPPAQTAAWGAAGSPAAGSAGDASVASLSSLRRRSNTAMAPAAAALDRSCPGYMPQQQQQQPTLPDSPASSSGGSTACDLQVLLSEGGSGSSSSKQDDARHKRQLLMSGLITAVGIALHNFPEGIAVLLAAQKSTAVGVSLAAAIALHNIPEGVAVALPVYFATGSRWRGLQTAVLSGLAEPLAVVLLGLVLPFMQLNKHVVDGMLAGVGGIMAFLSFHELLPLAMQHAGKPLAVGCLFGGMGLMSVTLHYLNTHVLADLH